MSTALYIPLARLHDTTPHEVALQHVGDMPSLPSTTANYVATLLAPSPTNARRDVYFIQAEPGETKRSQPHPQGTIEHVILGDRKSTRLNSSHVAISYAVFGVKKINKRLL